MKKWEYKTLYTAEGGITKRTELLNELGQEGWELVSANEVYHESKSYNGYRMSIDHFYTYTFKREIEEQVSEDNEEETQSDESELIDLFKERFCIREDNANIYVDCKTIGDYIKRYAIFLTDQRDSMIKDFGFPRKVAERKYEVDMEWLELFKSQHNLK